MNMSFEIEAIATVCSPYTQKFGIPRQPGLVVADCIKIVLDKRFSPHAVRGLDEFDYIWVAFIFHDALTEGWSELVRPPRLGGKIKKGVFATRTPHRPNHLGWSLLKLEHIEFNQEITLVCSGADLLDATPVVDIKPYIPFVEAKPNAKSGFVEGAPKTLLVAWSDQAWQQCCTNLANQQLIEQVLAQDPRPAYQDNPNRLYYLHIDGYEVGFKIDGQRVEIVFLSKQ